MKTKTELRPERARAQDTLPWHIKWGWGVAHCGPGPDAIDYLSALENWVENDIAPDSLEAVHLVTSQNYNGLPRLRFPLSPDLYNYTRQLTPYRSQRHAD